MKSLLFFGCLLATISCFSQAIPAKFKVSQGKFFVTSKDTVELTTEIRYIKVDGRVYEIRRTTSIEEARPAYLFQFRPDTMRYSPYSTLDSSIKLFSRGIPVGLPDPVTGAY